MSGGILLQFYNWKRRLQSQKDSSGMTAWFTENFAIVLPQPGQAGTKQEKVFCIRILRIARIKN
jgi:hypothetical protein